MNLLILHFRLCICEYEFPIKQFWIWIFRLCISDYEFADCEFTYYEFADYEFTDYEFSDYAFPNTNFPIMHFRLWICRLCVNDCQFSDFSRLMDVRFLCIKPFDFLIPQYDELAINASSLATHFWTWLLPVSLDESSWGILTVRCLKITLTFAVLKNF